MKTAAKNRLLFPAKTLLGALLLGFLWRVRGTHGWGSSWGLLNAGFVFLLYLNFAVDKKRYVSLPLAALTALSFMLTCPAWGTYLSQITGYLSVTTPADETLLYEISPVSGVLMMLLLGFGLASVFGVLLGRCFGKKAWRIRDYAAVLFTFLGASLGAKASVSHLLLRAVEPQAVTAFTDALSAAGMEPNAYGAYMAHFSAVSWAKKIAGTAGRNYFSSVATISLAVAAVAVLLVVCFFVRDRFAAKTGAVTCGAFACSITVSDLFFFFDAGGYRGGQGFSLPESFAAWSLWEYFTGFLAGGLITAFLLRTADREAENETLLFGLPQKPAKIFAFALAAVGGVGINLVRPALERIEPASVGIPVAVCIGVLVLVCALLYVRKRGIPLAEAERRLLSLSLCLLFVLSISVFYFFTGEANIRNIGMLHQILTAASAVILAAACCLRLCTLKKRKGE